MTTSASGAVGSGYAVAPFWNHQAVREREIVLDTIDAACRERCGAAS